MVWSATKPRPIMEVPPCVGVAAQDPGRVTAITRFILSSRDSTYSWSPSSVQVGHKFHRDGRSLLCQAMGRTMAGDSSLTLTLLATVPSEPDTLSMQPDPTGEEQGLVDNELGLTWAGYRSAAPGGHHPPTRRGLERPTGEPASVTPSCYTSRALVDAVGRSASHPDRTSSVATASGDSSD